MKKKEIFVLLTLVFGGILTYFALILMEDNLAPGSPPPDVGTISITAVSAAIVIYSSIQWKRIKIIERGPSTNFRDNNTN